MHNDQAQRERMSRRAVKMDAEARQAAARQDFIKEVQAASRHRFAVEVFADMVRCMAIALESPLVFGERHEHVEAEYEQIRSRYDKEEFSHFPMAFAIVQDALERRREDFLGHALEALGAANTRNGQFLTPVSVSRFMAQVNCATPPEGYKLGDVVRLWDPSCGSSVLLIEGAEQLVSVGVAQSDVLIYAGDIDNRACDISYVQLSLLGYAAVVQHADSLAMKRISPDRFTLGYFMHAYPMRRAVHRNLSPAVPSPSLDGPGVAGEPSSPPCEGPVQMELFAS